MVWLVHVGCGEGRLTAALSAHSRFRIHGLDRDLKQVEATRAHLRSEHKHGQATADLWTDKSLPYTDNLVNLLVIEADHPVAEDEIFRVLCPNGVALIRDEGASAEDKGWHKLVQPWPDNIDEWSHYLHGPDNNAVAKDTVVGSPHHLQWNGGPKMGRGGTRCWPRSVW